MKRKIVTFTMVLNILALFSMPARSAFEQQVTNARAAALGEAFTGLADNADAAYYNPAGLVQLVRPEVMGSYSRLYAGLDDGSNLGASNATYALPFMKGGVNRGTLAIGANIFSLSGLYSESTIGVFYGGRLNKYLALGGGVKYLSVKYENDAYTSLNPVFSNGLMKSAPSLDLGMTVYPFKYWSFGLALRNVNGPDVGLKTADAVPQAVSIGGAYRYGSFSVTSDIHIQGADYKLSAGGEKWLFDHQFAARAAFGIGSRRYGRFSTGLGYESDNLFIDYAFLYPLSGISETFGNHQVSFGYRFGQTINENEEEAKKRYQAAVTEIRAGDYQSARRELDFAIELVPEDRKYPGLRDKLSEVMGYVPKAQGDGKYEAALRNGIEKYLLEDDAKEAVNQLMYAFSLRPENEAVERLAKQIAKERNLPIEESAKTWNLAEQKVFQALEKFKQKKYDETIKLCEEALKLDPNNVTAYKRLGSTFYILHDYAKARRNWEKVIELAPYDPEVPQIRQLLGSMK